MSDVIEKLRAALKNWLIGMMATAFSIGTIVAVSFTAIAFIKQHAPNTWTALFMPEDSNPEWMCQAEVLTSPYAGADYHWNKSFAWWESNGVLFLNDNRCNLYIRIPS